MDVPLLNFILVRIFLVFLTTFAVNQLSTRSCKVPHNLLQVVPVRHVALVLNSVPYNMVDDII
jgi:hypothetical protein